MTAKPLLVDFHAHLHDSVSVADFLNHACANFRRSASRMSGEQKMSAVLCLADFPGAMGFKRLLDEKEVAGLPCWQARSQPDNVSILFESEDGDRIWVVAGFQVVSKEKLEIVALGTVSMPVPGKDLLQTLQEIQSLGALATLPWGVGKWLGKRGTIVSQAMKDWRELFVLGDNGGRPWCWKPRHFQLAYKKQIPVLPGSDPLPIKTDRIRNGSHGLLLTIENDLISPVELIKKIDFTQFSKAKVFGTSSSVRDLVVKQLLLRFE